MFGGLLQSSAVIAVQQCDLLVSAFSHQIYLFSLAEATLKDKVAAHLHPILHLHFDPKSSTLHSLDAHGIVYSFRVGKHAVLEQLQRRRAGKVLLREGRIRGSRQAEVEVLGLAEDGTLTRHVGQCEYLVAKEVNRILILNDDYLVLAKNNSHSLHLYSAASLQKLYEYESPIAVTSAEQYQNSLILGNEQGKIIVLVGFLVGGVVQLTQKLQWHVHAVSSLKVDGAYLYSAGEEGVVVVWHLRENKKDFLPRIGSAISNLQLIDSSVYCFLADNSLKAIDLSNDKAVLHYKLILNPNTQLIAASSKKLSKSLLVRASHRADRLFLRAGPGRIQELDLFSGINNEHAVISRNYVSRLDQHLPAPHQLTDICLSKDGTILAVVVEGIGCRSLRFFALQGGLRLVSKVENCHSGQSQITLLALNDNRFLSYTPDDSSVKVWRLTNRKKQSLLEIEQQFWSCDYEITFRKQRPLFVSANGNRVIITFEREFIAFNATSKSIEGVYRMEDQERQLVAVVPQSNKFLVFFNNSVELASTFNNAVGKCQLLLSLKHSAITKQSINLTQDNQHFAIFLQQQSSSAIYYSAGNNVFSFQVPATAQLHLEQVFWLKDRLIGVDSSLFFYDFTHEKQLVQLKRERKDSLSATEEEMDIEQNQTVHYSYLYRKYLERQFKKDRNAVQQSNQTLGVSPSISAAFQMLTPQLFL